jgi:multiple antibiotic resistance protein
MLGFIEALIPMFVVCDPFGLVPQLWALTEGQGEHFRKRVAIESCLASLVLGFVFALAGVQVFRVIGITTDDFRIGGGIVFLIMAVRMILGTKGDSLSSSSNDTSISIVPLATPLIVGPAVIANIVLLTQRKGLLFAMGVFTTVLTITAIFLFFSGDIRRVIGEKVGKAVSKIFAILMVGIAVMFIRVGIEGLLRSR